MYRRIEKIWLGLRLLLLLAAVAFLLAPEWPAFGDEKYRLRTIVGQRQFDFVTWQTRAIWLKSGPLVSRGQQMLGETARKQLVLNHIDNIARSQQLTAEINQIYVDPDVTDPTAATTELTTELTAVRAQIATDQPIVEAILQDQVAVILTEEGMAPEGLLSALWPAVWPPVMVQMTPLPSLLVVSPRDRIERIHAFTLVNGLPVNDRTTMETAVYDQMDLSALVVPIGGLSTYPSMILESRNLNWLMEVIAHEWAHHWLTLRPLGLNYVDPQVRIINETVASLVDREVGALAIARYYPELAPPETKPEEAPAPVNPTEPPAFDFRAEMAKTRVEVDRLLAAGNVEEAEAYMEVRREIFVENGYQIRKLNQAYFAFYGAYADRPGASGANPAGLLVQEARALSPSLRAFLETMAPITSLAELEETVAVLRSTNN